MAGGALFTKLFQRQPKSKKEVQQQQQHQRKRPPPKNQRALRGTGFVHRAVVQDPPLSPVSSSSLSSSRDDLTPTLPEQTESSNASVSSLSSAGNHSLTGTSVGAAPLDLLEHQVLQVLEEHAKSNNLQIDHVVTDIYNLLPNQDNVDRELVMNLYIMSTESCTRLDDQAKCLALTLQDLGLVDDDDDDDPNEDTAGPVTTSSGDPAHLDQMLSELSFVMEPSEQEIQVDPIHEPRQQEAPPSSTQKQMEQEPIDDRTQQQEHQQQQEESKQEEEIPLHLLLAMEQHDENAVAPESTPHQERIVACPVCMDDFPESQTMFFFCSLDTQVEGGEHSLCYECAFRYVQSNMNNTTAMTCYDQKCSHELMPHEIAMILGHGNMDAGYYHPLYREIDLRQRDQAISQDPQAYTTCPNPNCRWTAARSRKGAQEKVTCPMCFAKFCSSCNDRYHYRSTCREWQEIQLVWQEWKGYGRLEYWQQSNQEHGP